MLFVSFFSGAVENLQGDEASGGSASSEETHVCEKCCAEFFTWTEMNEHQRLCTEDPLVLIVKDSEAMSVPRESPLGASPVPSVASSDSSALESTDAVFELPNENDDLDNLCEGGECVEAMELQHGPLDEPPEKSDPRPLVVAEPPRASAAAGYGVPSTNVTLEILHSTRVAVAQFSQGINSCGAGGKSASAAIPVILEHLLALQQQQVHQLQLIEQICSQVAIMNRQPTQTALNPTSRSLSLVTNPFPSQGMITPPILPLSGSVPSAMNGQAAVSLSSVLDKSQTTSSKAVCGQSAPRDGSSTSASTENVAPTLASSSCSSSTSTKSCSLLPPFTGAYTSSVSCAQTQSTTSPLSLGQGCLLGSSPALPFLPQNPSSSVIFPNPLASIAATANALDPLAALMKHRKGKLPNVSLFESKQPSPEEPFFKHKCRFCAKVFGSDSALQIHLRSHTGERPFKCNICGNRFSTKGNLKVHFQRHKEKYPHVQMNPYPVPEYLDNMPTSSGIPYGMSIPPEKPTSSWLDSKPAVPTLPATLGLPPSSTITGIRGSNDPVSVTPSLKSSYQPLPFECVSLSPKHKSSEARFSPVSASLQSSRETETSDILKTEGVHLPQSCSLRLRANPETEAAFPPVATTPEPIPSASPISTSPAPSLSSDLEAKHTTASLAESMQASETSKLQQLVENIDKKITDPNQCVLCHRVLSCQSALRMHYRTHTGERPYKCKVCGRAFTTKGNLKAHVGVHRESLPTVVQHSCPICQKKFTNAVLLQQHIHMHMVGRIPDTLVDGLQEADSCNVSLAERAFDSLSSNGNEVDDVSMEDEEEDEEAENMEEVVLPPEPLTSDREFPPKSSAIISSIAALENQMKMIDCTVSLSHSFGVRRMANGFDDCSQPDARSYLLEKKAESLGARSPNAFESSSSPPVSPSPLQSSSESVTNKLPAASNHRPEPHEPPATTINKEQPESPTTQEAKGVTAVKEETLYSPSFQLSRERGAFSCCLFRKSPTVSLFDSVDKTSHLCLLSYSCRSKPSQPGHRYSVKPD